MVRDITLGQYIPGNSLIHKLDPRIKIIIVILFMILTFISFNFVSLAITFSITIVIILLSRISMIVYMKSLRVVLMIVIITSILNLFYGSGEILFQVWFIRITTQGIHNSIFIAFRIITLILISSVLTFTTLPTDLTDAIERLLGPLKIIHVPVHDIAMMMTIALRFVPTLLEETDKIMNAQKARGADFESGKLTERIKALIPVLVPLFVSSFRRAYDLALAMECRCYNGGEGRTRMKILHVAPLDYLALAVSLMVLAGIITSNIFVKI